MNLYRIKFIHVAPKDTGEGIVTYLLAENDVQVYNYIDQIYNYNCWETRNEEDEGDTDSGLYAIYDELFNVIGELTYREKVIHEKGDMFNDNYADAYYGITQYAWELVEKDIKWDPTKFIELKIINTINKEP